MQNQLYLAAILAEPEAAVDLLRRKLGLPESDLAAALMPDRQTWMRNSVRENMTAIASWITAECCAIADQSERIIPTTQYSDPRLMVGTAD